jgi:cellulose synthase/poly-beta-1,6-N-acetylglucosamine synthase-like glycosyltransferase
MEAILEGEVLPAELVVVDQSRGAGAEKALARCGDRGVPLTYLRQSRRGLSASRNLALERATQPIVAFTDDDCVPGPGWIGEIAQVFAAEEPPAAMTGRVLPLGAAVPGTFDVSPRDSPDRIDYRGRVVPWVVGTGGNFAARRQWLDRVGRFDERLGTGSPGHAAEDTELVYRLLRSGATIRYEPAAVVFHERQTKAQRLRSRWTYGFGIAAFCGLWLRRGDPYAGRLCAGWLAWQGSALLHATVRGDWFLARQRLLSLGGSARGLFYGLRMSP